MTAPAPGRSTKKLTITLGIVPISIDVYSHTEESSTSRSQYVVNAEGDLERVGVTAYNKITGKNVSADEIIKCVETDDGTIVPVSDEEMQAIVSAENGETSFIGFIDASEVTYVTDKSYQIRPMKSTTKKNPNEKPFTLLMEALKRTNTVALISFVSRGRTIFATITPDAMMHTVLYDEEVREQRPLVIADLSDAELSMGDQLVDAFRLTELPVFNDADSAAIMDFAVQKAKTLADGGTVALPTARESAAAPEGDLASLLAASIAAKKS